MNTKTTASLRPADVEKKWIVVDAENAVVGRLATFIAMRLRGKHRADYTPNVDCGDNVIVINADKIRLTGKKMEQKVYLRHTGYPGGQRSVPVRIMLNKAPERVLMEAVKGMLPKTRLGKVQLTNVRIYKGANHPHEAQAPTTL